MTGTEGEKWKEMPKRCRQGTMWRDNPYVGMPQWQTSCELGSCELEAGKNLTKNKI